MKSTTIIVAVAFLVFIPSLVSAGTYGSGIGEPNDPYLIYTPEQMNQIGLDPNDWNKHFKLMADLDLSCYTGTQFNRIGTSYNSYFTGTFDGNNHTVSNFTYTSTITDYVGLFGYLGSGSQVKNLGLTNVNVTGSSYTGGLVGYNSFGTITNSYAAGSVTSSSYRTGGLVGYNDGGTVTNSYATGNVTGYGSTGGLVGYNDGGTVTNSYATGNVTGYDSTGGLVGWNYYGTITNCYAAGPVIGSYCTGGLVGYNYDGTITNSYAAGSVTGSQYETGGLVGYNSGTITNCYATGNVNGSNWGTGGLVGCNNVGAITNCYATGNVNGSNWDTGGLVGENEGTITNSYATGNVTGGYTGGLVGYNSGTITASFWDIETTGQSTSAGGKGRTTAQMHQASTFLGWNSCGEVAWTIDEGNDYPRLVWQGRPGTPIPSYELTDFLAGSGEPNDPYLIYTPQELNAIGLFPCEWDKCFKLMTDIDLSAYAVEPNNPQFNCIGTGSSSSFTGTFDGNNHIISNFTYTSPTTSYVGLFGCLGSSGQIKNLGLTNVNVTGYYFTGGLVGWNYGTIANSYATGSVTGIGVTGGLVGYNGGTITNSYATGSVTGIGVTGGLVGYNGGTITNSYATGSVSGSQYTGGLAGYNYYGNITNCYAAGSVAGQISTGGLVGRNHYYYGIIANSYATGTVTGYSYTGGMVGDNSGTITNSYATGNVTSQANYTGGLVAINSGTITNSYATGNITGQCYYTGGLVGGNDDTITNCYATGDVTGSIYTGGLVGDNDGTITNSYATGSVIGLGFYTSDLISYWTFDEGGGAIANDAVGTNDGTLLAGQGGGIAPQWVAGKFGTALQFDGVSSYVNCGSDVSLKPAVVSVSAWVKQDAIDYYGQIAGFATDTGSRVESGYSILSDNSFGSGPLGYGAWVTGGPVTDGSYLCKISTGYTLGQWTHIAMTYDGSQTIVYVNGIPSAPSTEETGNLNYVYVTEFYIGVYWTPVPGQKEWWLPYTGLIDDVGVWGRSLTAEEVMWLAAGNPVDTLVYKATNPSLANGATGSVTGEYYTGGLVGESDPNNVNVTTSFWDIETTGQSTSAGGVGKTTAEMKTQSTFTVAGWNFVGEVTNGTKDIWRMCSDGASYPLLWWQFPAGDFDCPDGVNLKDLAFFAQYWLKTNCAAAGDCRHTDINISGTVDITDLSLFAMHWLEEP
jgi:hypothetical protein